MAEEREPTAALLIIGAEVLSGKIDDANGPYLIRALRARGVQVVELRIIGDSINEISQALRVLSAQVDDVYTTGGVGPTHDDVTVAGVAHAFERSVVHHPTLLELLQGRYQGKMNEARLKMAEVPQGGQVFVGAGNIVPVVMVQNVSILPGVPSLMRACFAALPHRRTGTPFVSHALLLNVAESDVAQILTDVQRNFDDVAIGSYPRFDDAPYRVKVTVDGRDTARVEAAMGALRTGLKTPWIVGEE